MPTLLYSKHTQASFSLILNDWLCLQVAQMSRCRDLMIFVVTTTIDRQTDRQTEYFSPVHVRRVIIIVCHLSLATKGSTGKLLVME